MIAVGGVVGWMMPIANVGGTGRGRGMGRLRVSFMDLRRSRGGEEGGKGWYAITFHLFPLSSRYTLFSRKKNTDEGGVGGIPEYDVALI